MEEYMNTLLEQLRCKKARDFVKQEISTHIQDQADGYMALEIPAEEAMALAVKDMGDPVETGISLDHIHRPQIAWSMIGVAALISIISIIIHTIIGYGNPELRGNYIQTSILHICLGFIVMLLVYRIDYSFMAKYSKILAFVFLGFEFMAIFFFATTMNGARSFWGGIFGIYISLIYFMLLFIPIYGALLYQYHGTGYWGVVKSMGWMVVPIFLSLQIPCLSLAILMFFMMAVLLTIAVLKNWFRVNKKIFLAFFWGCIIGFPLIMVPLAIKFEWLATYQSMRLKVLLGMVSIPDDYNYIGTLVKEYTLSSRLLGASGKEIIGFLPDYNTSYILTFLGTYYGMAVVFTVCCLLGFIIFKTFHISFRQKNQLGMMMGCGCGLVFLTSTIINIFESFGVLLATETFLPFVSAGGTGVIISYILLGIVLSIYRYKSILPSRIATTKGIKIRIVIEK